MNSTGISECDKLVGHVFPPFVALQFLDFRIELVFSSSLEQLEGLKCLALSLQAHGSSVGRRIIKEGDPFSSSNLCGWQQGEDHADQSEAVQVVLKNTMEAMGIRWSAFYQQGKARTQCLACEMRQMSSQSPKHPSACWQYPQGCGDNSDDARARVSAAGWRPS